MTTPNTNTIEAFDNLPLFYKGRLNEAIQKVSSTSLDLFVLYVIDFEEDQTEVLKCISHQAVISFVKSKCILYKIKKDSAEFDFFSQHYPNHSNSSCFYFFDINGKVFKSEDIKKGFTFISILSLFKTSNEYFEKQKQSLNSSKIEQKSKERRLVLQKTFCTKPVTDNIGGNTPTSPTTTTTTTNSSSTSPTETTPTTIKSSIKKKSPEPEPYIPNDDYITKATMTTLIFKLTSGETLKAEFSVNDRLKDIKEFIKNNRTDENRPFDMMTIYPKYLFKVNDYEKTLLELNLVPSATITLNPLDVSTKVEKKSSASAIIHPPSKNPQQQSSSSSSGSYFSSVKNYFSGFFGGTIEQSESKEQDNNRSKSSSSNSSQSSQVKKRTNIHQISGNNDGDDHQQRKQYKDPKDDNSYYNGNSTQFNGK
ncbi:hypothetical protein RB653_007391 [Dictyostelium firmibasis]|uniref:UBX domain-containing protein n=1 Tax=Dictyostelium firmibasis TaxID=79012 RepID=A0AAN7TWF4_9MYCE